MSIIVLLLVSTLSLVGGCLLTRIGVRAFANGQKGSTKVVAAVMFFLLAFSLYKVQYLVIDLFMQ